MIDPREALRSVSVIIPCRNGGELLGPHLESLREWLPGVHEVIVVDSSDDDSVERIEAGLDGFNPRIFRRPPGLYEAWNFGVEQATGEFVNFSTIGDSAFPDGVTRLVGAAVALNADIVVSPPQVIDPAGEILSDHVWPIHRFLSRADAPVGRIFSELEKVLACCSFLPETLIGSSASNLYRRGFLRQHPFPTEFGHVGDAAWAISIVPAARFAVIPDVCARFVVHARADEDDGLGVIRSTQALLDCVSEMIDRMEITEARSFLGAWLEVQRGQYEKRFFQPLESAVLRGKLNEEKNLEIQTQKKRNTKVVAKRLEVTELLRKEREQSVESAGRVRALESSLAKSLEEKKKLDAKNRALAAELENQRARVSALRSRVATLEGPGGLNGKLIDAADSLGRIIRSKK